jgi:hypothetical protein
MTEFDDLYAIEGAWRTGHGVTFSPA